MSTVTAAPPTQQQALVTALRALADTIEQHDLQVGSFASVGYGKVRIGSDAFKDLFRGKVLQGKREGGTIAVEAEYAGIVFATNLFVAPDNGGFENIYVE